MLNILLADGLVYSEKKKINLLKEYFEKIIYFYNFTSVNMIFKY